MYTILSRACFLLVLVFAVGCNNNAPSDTGESNTGASTTRTENPPPVSTQPIKVFAEFDLLAKDSLDGWEVTNFGGEGECSVNEGVLTIEMGYPLSGISSTIEDLPTDNYEISLEAKRNQGIDFFCGLTFPVKDSHCTLIVGGWAGAVVGLSCVDDEDASSNETKTLMKFEKDRWYKIRVKVGESIEAWIDEKKVVDLPTKDRKFSLRAETSLCKPLGICTFETTAEFRNIGLKEDTANWDDAPDSENVSENESEHVEE